jgi:hypothetical protein
LRGQISFFLKATDRSDVFDVWRCLLQIDPRNALIFVPLLRTVSELNMKRSPRRSPSRAKAGRTLNLERFPLICQAEAS